MKLSERLLQIFDAKAAADRAQLQAQAANVDAVGEILSTAHYAGIDLSPESIVALGNRILIVSGAPQVALEWMLSSGFNLQRTRDHQTNTHHYLAHPDIGCPVAILTPHEGTEP